jgi:hypothetical protein
VKNVQQARLEQVRRRAEKVAAKPKKTLLALKYDRRVEMVCDETPSDWGYLIYLNPGWQYHNRPPGKSNKHAIQLMTVRGVTWALRHEVFPCACSKCASGIVLFAL